MWGPCHVRGVQVLAIRGVCDFSSPWGCPTLASFLDVQQRGGAGDDAPSGGPGVAPCPSAGEPQARTGARTASLPHTHTLPWDPLSPRVCVPACMLRSVTPPPPQRLTSSGGPTVSPDAVSNPSPRRWPLTAITRGSSPSPSPSLSPSHTPLGAKPRDPPRGEAPEGQQPQPTPLPLALQLSLECRKRRMAGVVAAARAAGCAPGSCVNEVGTPLGTLTAALHAVLASLQDVSLGGGWCRGTPCGTGPAPAVRAPRTCRVAQAPWCLHAAPSLPPGPPYAPPPTPPPYAPGRQRPGTRGCDGPCSRHSRWLQHAGPGH